MAESEKKYKQKSKSNLKSPIFSRGGWPGRFGSMCTALHSLGNPFLLLLSFPSMQLLCRASLMGNAGFSDGETEALSNADVPQVTWPKARYLVGYLPRPEGLRARDEGDPQRPPTGNQMGSFELLLRARPIWKLSPPLILGCRGGVGGAPDSVCICSSSGLVLWPSSSPGNPISQAGRATLIPATHPTGT